MRRLRGGLRRVGYRLLERSLRRTFRRVVWVGPWSPPAPDRPVVLYANHHAFHDAQVLGWMLERTLGRRTIVWMEALERFPFFRLLGATPFPADRPAVRVAEVRRTRRLMGTEPRTALVYFPEAVLHPADEGLAPFPADRCMRLDRVLPSVQWWPVILRVTGWHDARPTAELYGGPVHAQTTGRERETLEELLASPPPSTVARRTLLEGRAGPHERWDFSAADRLFAALR